MTCFALVRHIVLATLVFACTPQVPESLPSEAGSLADQVDETAQERTSSSPAPENRSNATHSGAAPETRAEAAPEAQAQAAAPQSEAAPKAPPTGSQAQRPTSRTNLTALRKLEDRLRALVQRGAMEEALPWALAHGLVPFGPDLRTDRGQLAVDAIAAGLSSVEYEGRSVLRFPPKTKRGLPFEAHPDHMIRTFVLAGVPMDRKLVTASGSTVTVARVVADAEWFFNMPTSPRDWKHFAWSAELFFAHRAQASTSSAPLHTARGDLPIAMVAAAAVERIEKEQSFLLPAMKANRPEAVEKRRQGIYSHTCGGLHLVQAGVRGAALTRDPKLIERMRQQIEVLRFRWRAERGIYRKTLKANPEYAPLILVQELKFFGHVLETLAISVELGVLSPTSDIQGFFLDVAADLDRTVLELEPIYAAQESIRRVRAQTYYDLIGDGCHGIRGLDLGMTELFKPPS